MTIHQVPARPAEKCLFPTRNRGPSPTEDVGVTHVEASSVVEGVRFSKVAGRDPQFFFVTIWALVLQMYVEVNTVQMGWHTFSDDSEEGLSGAGIKKHMKLLATSLSQARPLSDLFKEEGWSISKPNWLSLSYFNSAMILFHGRTAGHDGAITLQESLKITDDEETCDVILAIEADHDWSSPKCSLVYKTRTLSTGQAEHLASYLAEAIRVAAADESLTPSQLSIVSKDHLNHFMKWNADALMEPSAQTMHQIISDIAMQRPETLALVTSDESFTYSQLDAMSSRLAYRLKELGVSPGVMVLVCFEKSLRAIVAMLAINKAGGAFVPLDPIQPLGRLQDIAKQLNSPLGLASPQNEQLLNKLTKNVLVVSEETLTQLRDGCNDGTDLETSPTAPAYCLFTSGSTGQPKGCVVDHAALASIACHSSALHLLPGSRVLQFASFTFGISLIEIWCTLLAGGTVCMLSDTDRVNRLPDAIEDLEIDWAIITPTVLTALHSETVPGLRTVVVAGEPLKEAQISLWAEQTRLFQAYGFTEWAGICCVSRQIQSVADIGIIGTTANARSWLTEPNNPNQLAPIGSVAELVIEGPSLAQGYLNAPEATTARFIQPPSWAAQANAGSEGKLYMTGDLVYYDPGGILRYVGRKDRQVKMRGQRVDLGELEYHFAQASSDVPNAVIDAITPSDWEEGESTLVGFVPMPQEPIHTPTSSQSGEEPVEEEIQGDESFFVHPNVEYVSNIQQIIQSMKMKLPEYLVPRVFVQVKEMPLTVTGKIARRTLREAAEKLRHDELIRFSTCEAEDAIPPVTHYECLVHQLVAEMLRLPAHTVGMNHGFLSLGGDSVRAMKLVGKARSVGIKLRVKDILNSANLGALAQVASEVDERAPRDIPAFSLLPPDSQSSLLATAVELCETDQIDDIYPCTPLQEGMAALSAAAPGAYLARFVHRLNPDVDQARLCRAWESVVAATPILRTRIVSGSDGRMYQVVLKVSFQWDTPTENWHGYIKRRQSQPFLVGGPLVHAALIPDPSSSVCFVVTMHHSLCDRWASGLMLDRLEDAYDGKLLSLDPMTPFLHYLSGLQGEAEYWKFQFQGLQAEEFPSLPSPGYIPSPSERYTLSVPYDHDPPTGYTISNVIRLAWALVINHYTGCDDTVFGVTLSGRGAPVSNIERLAAPTVTTVPLRVQLSNVKTVLEALAMIQTHFTEMIPFEQFGLQRIRHLSEEAQQGCNFQSHLVIQPAWEDENRPLLTTCEADAAVTGGFAHYGLSMICHLTGSRQLNIAAEFDPKVVSQPVTERLIRHFEHTFRFLLANQDVSLVDVPVISATDLNQLREWNSSPPPSQDSCVQDIIKQRCEEYPATTAVWAWDGKWTYGELHALSERLATTLSAHGVGPEVFVPICMEKSCWSPVAILGVIKAGGAFVLLDPSQPQQRLEGICRQIGAELILTSESSSELAATLALQSIIIGAEQVSGWTTELKATIEAISTQSSNALYIAFTSGSTGVPKGVVVEHRAFCSSALALNAATDLTSNSRLLQFAGYPFDGSIMETLSALMAGACLCVPSEFQRQNELAQAAAEYNLTHAHLTPSLARHILPAHPNFTEVLVSVGEPMTAWDVTHWASNGTCRVMNGYGPAECAVSTTIQPRIVSDSHPQNLGFPLAGACWIVNSENHDVLLPIGAVGELLVEGPTLARGYLHHPDQTAAAFIASPKWMQAMRPGRQTRLYKTGDMARFNNDGSLQYVGRRDNQVKLRGQRIELGDVEKHVRQSWPALVDVAVDMVHIPSLSTQRLVAFVVTEPAPSEVPGDLLAPHTAAFQAQVAEVHAKMSEILPSFMVPKTFLPVKVLPRSVSTKIDRRRLRDLATAFSTSQLAEWGPAAGVQKKAPQSDTEHTMQAIWAQILNRPLLDIGMEDSFYRLGGDSITAMQVVAQARSKGLAITLDQILRFKTIDQILFHAGVLVHTPAVLEPTKQEPNVWFALSPMQQMFLDQQGQQSENCNHFSQSFLLRVNRSIEFDQLKEAVNGLLSRHSILRARLEAQPDGRWGQLVRPVSDESCRCQTHSLQSREEVNEVTSKSTQEIDIEKGPMMVVDLMEVEPDHTQYLFIAINHLVVDLVSWRIILSNIESLLKGEPIAESNSIQFQTWCRLQAEYAERSLPPKIALPVDLPNEYYQDPTPFWGLEGRPNRMQDIETHSFTLDEDTTRQLLGAANTAYDTAPVDILHAALLHAFLRVFPARPPPLTFSEDHGRQPWDPAVDLSQTVGWFTTVWPVVVKDLVQGLDIGEVIRRVKDARRADPSKGWGYFTSRYFHPDGRQEFQKKHPMELTFNYTGEYQQFERSDALLVPESHGDQGALHAGGAVQRFSIFEVFASVMRGRLQFQFMYPKEIQHQNAVQEWVQTCCNTLQAAATELTQRDTCYTLSDFPLMQLMYPQLDELLTNTLPSHGVSLANVEDIYPCSPSQRGMLIAQAKESMNYNASVTWKIQSQQPNLHARIYSACQRIIQRHAALRTIFVDSPSPEAYMDQVVLKHVSPDAAIMQPGSQSALDMSAPSGWLKGELAYKIHLQEIGNGDVHCRLDMSHTIMDRTTIQIIQRDLCLAFDEKLAVGTGPLYSGYISYIHQQDTDSAAEYWKGYLEDVEPCRFPSLTTVDDPASECEWGHAYKTLSSGHALEEFCQAHSVTIWNVACLAWALVLRSFTHSDQVCFGYIKSGRDLPIEGIEDAVGAVFNPLPCYLQLGGEKTVKDMVHELQDKYLDSLPHQTFPFSDILRLAGITDGVLTNTSVSVQGVRAKDEASADKSLDFTILDMEDGAEDDLVVTVLPQEDKVTLHLRYKTSVLLDSQATTVIATFEKAISSILADDEARVTEVELLSDHDREVLWAEHAQVPPAVELPAHEIVQQHMNQPDHQAVCAWDGDFTYGELDRLSLTLARHLVAHGVHRNDVVPLCFEKSRWTPVAMMAVIRAGGAFQLMDMSYPSHRLRDLCAKVNCQLVISSLSQADRCMEFGPQVVVFGDNCDVLRHGEETMSTEEDEAVALPQVRPDDALYVVFTSGSTGNPKGCVIEHQSYCSGARDHILAFNMDSTSRVLQFSSYAFDMSILEQLSVLMAGGCICIISDAQRKNNLGEAAKALQTNYAMLIPSVARLFRHEDLDGISKLLLAGECVNETDVSYWAPNVLLMNGYGPAECSALSVVNSRFHPKSDPRNVGNPVGAIPWVVDSQDYTRLVPRGAIGELVMEGPIVGRGYINDPERTAQGFVPQPAWLQALRQGSHSRLYKTGDLVRVNANGTFTILGRKDRQVKMRGQRLELGEVEVHVQQCFEGSRHVVAEVIAPADTSKRQLVAFVQLPQREENQFDTARAGDEHLLDAPNDGFASQVAATEAELRRRVPDFMVPAIFLPLIQAPRTQSDKVDRNCLRSIVASMSLKELQAYRGGSTTTSPSGSMPCTPDELALAEIWGKVLSLPANSISTTDSFFLRGGDSIDAMKAAALGRSAGLALNVADIFAYPVLSDLARVAVPKVKSISTSSCRPFSLSPMDNPKTLHAQLAKLRVVPLKSTLGDLLPATQAQDFFIQRGTFHSWNFTITGMLDRDRLRAACDTLTSRFGILRTKFLDYEDKPMQMILDDVSADFREFQTKEDPSTICQSVWEADVAELDFRMLQPARFTLISRSETEHIFSVQMSHAQWDGVSLPRFFADVAATYNQQPLAPTSDFATYVYHRVSEDKGASFDFWREYLSGAVMDIPFPRTLCMETESKTNWAFKGIPTPELPTGITMASLVKAASSIFLARHLGKRDLVFGHTVNGRNIAVDNVESLLGCCLNFIPLRVIMQSSWTVLDLLEHVQYQYIRCLPHEHLEVSDILENSTDWAGNTPLNFIVQHQNIDLSYTMSLDGLDVKYSRNARFDPLDEVWFFSEPHPEMLQIQICANTRVLAPEQGTAMCDALCELIQQLSSSPDKNLSTLLDV